MTDPTETAVARWTSETLDTQDLGHSQWGNAQPAQLTRYWSGALAPEQRHAEARLLWSNEGIHVRFVCNQAEPLVISDDPQTDTKTVGLWDRDVCEIFLAPNVAEPEHYLEFEASPKGEWIDLALHTTGDCRKTDWEFRSGMTATAAVANGRVTIGMTIPWGHRIPLPEVGDRWLVNLFRCVGSGEDRGYLAWQPTYTAEPAFHVPAAFGKLLFA